MIIISRKDGKSKWIVRKCKICNGIGRYALNDEEVKYIEYSSIKSIPCPECEGFGYKKEISFQSINQIKEYNKQK